jgi:hypothetical protein
MGRAVRAIILEDEFGTPVTDKKPIPEFVMLVKGTDTTPHRVSHQINLAKSVHHPVRFLILRRADHFDQVAPVILVALQVNDFYAL